MNPTLKTANPREVIVADDDRTMRKIIGTILEENGYVVSTAVSGLQLLDRLRRGTLPSLVVTDWEMPGASGVDVCHKIRNHPDGDRYYMIVVTAGTTEEHLLTALNEGADDYLPKPFRVPELLARVRAGARVLEMRERLARKVEALEKTLAGAPGASATIPLCPYCQRVRTGPHEWQTVEEYLEAHAGPSTPDAACEECAEALRREAEDERAA